MRHTVILVNTRFLTSVMCWKMCNIVILKISLLNSVTNYRCKNDPSNISIYKLINYEIEFDPFKFWISVIKWKCEKTDLLGMELPATAEVRRLLIYCALIGQTCVIYWMHFMNDSAQIYFDEVFRS